MDTLNAFIISLIASLIAVYCTMRIEKYKLPKLSIEVDEDDKYRPSDRVRWLFYKIIVTNKKTIFPRFIVRETAESCYANIEFYKKNNHFFTMKGRWSSTPQIPDMPKDMWKLISNFPQPVSIPADQNEHLDILTQSESDNNAYGFNNISYLHDQWKNEEFKLEEGTYQIKVNISTKNGISHSTVSIR